MAAQLDKFYFRTGIRNVATRLVAYFFFEGRPLTTKGRWINPFVFASFRFYALFFQLKKVDKLAYVVGTGRSGTTILSNILGVHRKIGFLNEPKAIWHYVLKQEDVIGSYTMKPSYFRLNHLGIDKKQTNLIRKIYGAFLFFSGRSVVLDKYPELIFRVTTVKTLLPAARFIFIVRNGWDTVQSISNWSEKHGASSDGHIHDWWGVDDRKWIYMVEQLVAKDNELSPFVDEIREFSDHRYRAIVEWVLAMKEGLLHMEQEQDSMLMIKYEALTADPAIGLQEILDFLGLKEDPKMMEYANCVIKENKPYPTFEMPVFLFEEFERISTKLGYQLT